MAGATIVARDLRMSYGDVEAVRGIDLEVQTGEIFALLGPNGAGKTTTVEIFEGYRERSGGDVEVLGIDPAKPTREWRSRIGVVLQTCRMPPELTVQESLELFAGYYPKPRSVAETVALVGLTEQRDKRAGHLSGGQQRRLDMAIALVGDPDLVFLDEPTTGFDPGARREAWEAIAALRDVGGKTVLLTTHYMDEATRLADRVAIIARGQIVAEGPPGEIGSAEPVTTITFRLPAGIAEADLPGGAAVSGGVVSVQATTPQPVLRALLDWADGRGADLSDLEVRRESLEDVYLQLTAGT